MDTVNKAVDSAQALAQTSSTPKVGDLINEFKRSGMQGDHYGRIRLAEDTRLSRWDGQSDDGKRHQKNLPNDTVVFPWEGASDVKNYQADEAVNETVALKVTAFWSAILKVVGTEAGTLQDGSVATQFLDWLVHYKLVRSLDMEVELSAQFMETLGATALHVYWEREVGRKLVKVKLDEIKAMGDQARAAMAQQAQAGMAEGTSQTAEGLLTSSPTEGQETQEDEAGEGREMLAVLAVLDELIQDPSMEKEAVKAIQYVFQEFVEQKLPADLRSEDITVLSGERARQAVKDFRANGEAELPMPYLCKNEPCIRALKPYRDFIIPPETGDVQRAPVVFVRDLLPDAEVRKMVLGDKWDPLWVEEAVKSRGKISEWQLQNTYLPGTSWQWKVTNTKSMLIEVVYAFYKSIDADGITQINYTIFSPHFTAAAVAPSTEIAARHGILNYPRPEYYFVLGRRERVDRPWVATRGLGELLSTSQQVEKAMLDGIVDLAGISVVPPLNVPPGMSGRYKIGPATQNEIKSGRPVEFMNIPTGGFPVTVETINLVRERVRRYAGQIDAGVPAQLTALVQQPAVKKFLLMWGEALQLAYELTVHFAPEKIEEVTGQAPTQNAESFHYTLSFDAAQLHPELMEQKLKAFTELSMEDVEGVMDKGALVRIKANMIDPALAKQIVVDKGQASEKLFRDTANDILQMFAGNEPLYQDASNDPAAAARHQYATQILQKNPNYTKRLTPETVGEIFGPQAAQAMMQQAQMSQAQGGQASQPDTVFSGLLSNYFKNLQMGMEQQQNKMVGRTGVKQLR